MNKQRMFFVTMLSRNFSADITELDQEISYLNTTIRSCLLARVLLCFEACFGGPSLALLDKDAIFSTLSGHICDHPRDFAKKVNTRARTTR